MSKPNRLTTKMVKIDKSVKIKGGKVDVKINLVLTNMFLQEAPGQLCLP